MARVIQKAGSNDGVESNRLRTRDLLTHNTTNQDSSKEGMAINLSNRVPDNAILNKENYIDDHYDVEGLEEGEGSEDDIGDD